MALHYFIDAYNLIHSSPRWDDLSGEKKREQLIRFLEDEKPTGSSRNTVTVVFDGHSGGLGMARPSFVYVVFSANQDADTVIKQRVDALSSPKDAVVVTNDRAIQKWVRGAGAKIMSCEDFLSSGQQDQPRKKSTKLDANTVQSINEEMKKIWKMK